MAKSAQLNRILVDWSRLVLVGYETMKVFR